MPDQLVLALFTLFGVVIGGVANYISAVRTKNREWRLALVRARIDERQKLYAELLVAAQELSLQSVLEKAKDIRPFNPVISVLARVELVASDPVVEAARKLCSHVFDVHQTNPPKTDRLLHHEKTDFIKVVRSELQQLEQA